MAKETTVFISDFITKFKDGLDSDIDKSDWDDFIKAVGSTHTINSVEYKCGKVKHFQLIFDAFVEKQKEFIKLDRATTLMAGWQINWLKHIGLETQVIMQLPLLKVSPKWCKLVEANLVITLDNIERKMGMPIKYYDCVMNLKSYLSNPPAQFVYGDTVVENQSLLINLITLCLDFAKGLMTKKFFLLNAIKLEKEMVIEYKKSNHYKVSKMKEWAKIELRATERNFTNQEQEYQSLKSEHDDLVRKHNLVITDIDEKKNEIHKLHLILKNLRERKKTDIKILNDKLTNYQNEFDLLKNKYDSILIELDSKKIEDKKITQDYEWIVEAMTKLNAKYYHKKEECSELLYGIRKLKENVVEKEKEINSLRTDIIKIKKEFSLGVLVIDGKAYDINDLPSLLKTIKKQEELVVDRDHHILKLNSKIQRFKQLFQEKQLDSINSGMLEHSDYIPIQYWKIQDDNEGRFVNIDNPYLFEKIDNKKMLEHLFRCKNEAYPKDFINPRCLIYKGFHILPGTLEHITKELFEPVELIDWLNLYKITGDDNIAWSVLDFFDVVFQKDTNLKPPNDKASEFIMYPVRRKEIESCKLFCNQLLNNQLPVNVGLYIVRKQKIH